MRVWGCGGLTEALCDEVSVGGFSESLSSVRLTLVTSVI